jgi:hypothetical protein
MSSIQVAKKTMQYQGIATAPQQCQSCKFAAPSDATFAGRFHCARGGFFVAGIAGCKDWSEKKEISA